MKRLTILLLAIFFLPAVFAVCTDYDGASSLTYPGSYVIESYVYGTPDASTAFSTASYDTCTGSTVKEWYCSATKYTTYVKYSCPYSCAQDGSGKCSPTYFCNDPDGSSLTTQATATDSYGSLTDSCPSVYSSTVNEISCGTAMALKQTTVACPALTPTCVNGACVKLNPVCIDSDKPPADYLHIQGTATDEFNTVLTDECQGTCCVKEFYCGGAKFDTRTYTYFGCPVGEECKGTDGKCTPKSTCSDSIDGGPFPDIAGKTTDNSGINYASVTKADSCGSGNILTEYSCDVTTNQMKSAGYTCTYGCSSNANGGYCLAAPAPTCTDTDGGQVYATKGTTTDNSGTVSDVCSGSTLTEYYCSPALARLSTTTTCANGCSNGACSAAPAPTCSETDGGQFPNTAGKTTDNSGVNYATVVKSDTCSGTAAGSTITEWSCDTNNQMKSSTSTCANGCSSVGNANGDACLAAASPTCTDSDSGQNFDVQGTATDNSGALSDVCSGSTLTEYYCSPALARLSATTTCANGCSSGACTAAVTPTCTDSDEGPDAYFVEGTTTDATGTTSDLCKSFPPSDLIESICVNGVKTTETYTCPNGCSGSVCNPVIPEEVPVAFCSEDDVGSDVLVAGTTTDNTGSYPDTCSGGALIEYSCNPDTNQMESTTTSDCSCVDGACAPGGCIIEGNSWQDEYDNAIETAVTNYPVSAVVVGQGCATANFDIIRTDINDPNPVTTQNDITYTLNGNTGEARIEWAPLEIGSYAFKITSLSDGGGPALPYYHPEILLTVKGSCSIDPAPEACPAEWVPRPENQDLDCDGIQDCWDYWLGNAGCALDPGTGVPVCAPSCEGTAWNCDDAEFSECIPDPDDQESFIQTRDVAQCTKTGGDGEYCPPPSNQKGCVMQEDFPIFGLMNLLGVSILLIAFYSRKFIKIKF